MNFKTQLYEAICQLDESLSVIEELDLLFEAIDESGKENDASKRIQNFKSILKQIQQGVGPDSRIDPNDVISWINSEMSDLEEYFLEPQSLSRGEEKIRRQEQQRFPYARWGWSERIIQDYYDQLREIKGDWANRTKPIARHRQIINALQSWADTSLDPETQREYIRLLGNLEKLGEESAIITPPSASSETLPYYG